MTILGSIAGAIAVIFALMIVIMAVGIGINLLTRVPYAACPHTKIARIFDTLNLSPHSRVYDLGCGDGRVVFAAAARDLRATGYELQPLTYLRAKVVQFLRYPAADIRYGDFRRANLSDADVVFCFLVGSVMPQVANQLARQLHRGTRVISYGFPLPGWTPIQILKSDHRGGSHTYFYKI